jgi:uncharacterized membrane protein
MAVKPEEGARSERQSGMSMFGLVLGHKDAGAVVEPMRIAHWAIWISLAAVFTFSCGSDTTDRLDETGDAEMPDREDFVAEGVLQVWRGHFVYGHEVRAFRPCGREEPLWALEPSGLLRTLCERRVSAVTPYPEVFAVVEARAAPAPTDGFGRDYSGSVRIEAVLYAGLEGPGCDEDWAGFEYRARGNEPFWSAEVSGGQMRVSKLGFEDRLCREVSVECAPDEVKYTGIDENGTRVELVVKREPCRDSMADAYYAFTAVLSVGDEVLHGCALLGASEGAPDG